MPEEFENSPSGEVENPVEEAVPEQEAVEAAPVVDRRVPYGRFAEVNEAKNRAEQELHQMRLAMLQMQQQMATPREVEPEVDPEIDRLVAPIVEKHTRYLKNELAQRDQILSQVAAKAEADQAWNYVTANVPDIEELKPDIVAYLESVSPAMAQKYTSDPDNVVMVANFVRAQKLAGNSNASKAAKADLKGRAKVDQSGSSRVPTTGNNNVDWSNMSANEFAEAQRKMGVKPFNEW
jgi:hypothetical protein